MVYTANTKTYISLSQSNCRKNYVEVQWSCVIFIYTVKSVRADPFVTTTLEIFKNRGQIAPNLYNERKKIRVFILSLL